MSDKAIWLYSPIKTYGQTIAALFTPSLPMVKFLK
jgi:hypothetical protein